MIGTQKRRESSRHLTEVLGRNCRKYEPNPAAEVFNRRGGLNFIRKLYIAQFVIAINFLDILLRSNVDKNLLIFGQKHGHRQTKTPGTNNTCGIWLSHDLIF
jgi:hypothetical protein